MSNHEAYSYVYMVASHTETTRDKTILVTGRYVEAVDAANKPEPGEVRVIYGCSVRGYAANRQYVCGDALVLRKMDRKRKGGAR